MGVNAIIISTEVNNELYNGEDFLTDQATKFAPNLIGSVMERVQVTQTIQIGWESVSTEINTFTVVTAGGLTTIVREVGNWSADGMSIGDSVAIITPLGTAVADITNVAENTLIFVPGLVGINDGEYNGDTSIMTIIGAEPLTALYYKFGLVGNDESINFVSKVTGNEQGYYGTGIGLDLGGGVRDTSFIGLNTLSTTKDWVTGTAKCRYVKVVEGRQEFEIVHDFIINPYFVDGDLQNLQDKIITELFAGFNTLKYVNELDFRTSITNPASSKIKGLDYVLGSTAWFNENMDGLKSDYYIESISYKDALTLEDVSVLQASRKTQVTIEAKKISGNFVSGNKCGVYVSYLPSAEEYTDTETNFIDNFVWDSGFSVEGAGVTTGKDVISNISSSISTDTLTVIFDVEYSVPQYSNLINKIEPYYLISLQCADISKDFDKSDRVNLIGDVQNYNTDLNLEGLMNVEAFQIWQHEQDPSIDPGTTDWAGWIEDGLVTKLNFSLDLDKEAFVLNIKQTLIAYNDTTGESFELDSFNIATENAVVSGGVQQLNIDTTKGYELVSNDAFNEVRLYTGLKIGSLQSYSLIAAQKISWQNWQGVPADAVFYDSSKPLNNLNRKASNYSGVSDYEIKLSYLLTLYGVDDNGQAGQTGYLVNSPDISVKNYEVSDNYTAVIETLDPDTLANLDGAVYTNKETLLKITYTRFTGPVSDISDFWAVSRLEATGQQGFEIYELSTLRAFPSNNPLQPLAGETQLKMYIHSGTVVTECMINPSGLDSANGFNLSGRLSGVAQISEDTKITEAGEMKVTEANETKIIE